MSICCLFTCIGVCLFLIGICIYFFGKRARALSITPTVITENIIDIMTESLVVTDTSGRIILVNNSLLKLLGYENKEIIGRSVDDLFDDGEEFSNRILQILLETGSFENDETNLRTKIGREIPVIFSGSVIKNKTGNSVGFIISARDLTAHKRAEMEKEKLHEQLFHSEKMATVGQLIASIAHELNNPMGVILGFTQSMMKKISENDTLSSSLKAIEREVIKCRDLIKDLLIFHSLTKVEFEVININSIIDEVFLLMKFDMISKNISIEKKYNLNLPDIKAIKNQIQQVIISLFNNAIDAMQNGGTLTIITNKVSNFVEIRVKDTGVGMAEEVKKRVFDPFFTTKQVCSGVGLGLSVCYEIIKKHNGIMEVESEVGKGSIFVVKLPI